MLFRSGRLVGEITDPTPESVLAALTALRPAPAAVAAGAGSAAR